MIELVIAERCTGCNACVEICPTNVLAPRLNGPPEIAHQQDCQTCFMCELYCREDAIYVAPDCENPTDVDKEEIVASGLLGEFRRNHGWDEWAADPRYSNEHWRMESVFLRARDIAIAEAAAKRKNEQR
ncbi:ferredoxin family protein [Mesorhizobium sp. YR577]|uniref:4Fe-4S dicluster domain-containing protein n=1 Tax=Mesorhizobium sp. YR577 TaxID=1884373 RepID=UPI0008F0DAE6|nr:ferredoxin family protein [Mesorhizobium sp. YR577]SFU20478.1 NAD-dependent dihydropyrimidine dehydrogenase, PreA subunit [Mesorhizobium sp. YR577]